jgi:hypothetical protein
VLLALPFLRKAVTARAAIDDVLVAVPSRTDSVIAIAGAQDDAAGATSGREIGVSCIRVC